MPIARKHKNAAEEKRIVIIDPEKCKFNTPAWKYLKRYAGACGKKCIEVINTPTLKECRIWENACAACLARAKKCPGGACTVVKLPTNLTTNTTHQYGMNAFKLHGLPTPRPGSVLGLLGTNGIGKSTALRVLSGKIKPNLGQLEDPAGWGEIIQYYRGSDLQNYFTRLVEDRFRCVIKPQYVDNIPRAVKGTVGEVVRSKDERGLRETLCRQMELQHLEDRDIGALSGGELQRLAITVTASQEADCYMFDEPSSYLDVRQRLTAAQVIRALIDSNEQGNDAASVAKKYVVVVEHDLSVLDYLSDFICCLYGAAGAYGVVTMPYGHVAYHFTTTHIVHKTMLTLAPTNTQHSVREGINIFLAGYIPMENMRFRSHELTFKVTQNTEEEEELRSKSVASIPYPDMAKTMVGKKKKSKKFRLNIKAGFFQDSEIVVLLGENGTGKTTFIRMLAGLLLPDGVTEKGDPHGTPELNISYKPQRISPRFKGTVRMLLQGRINSAFHHPQFKADVVRPMMIEPIADQEVLNLSGGELQRVALVLALGKPADVYLIDEPSAYLDAEQRVIVAKMIKRFILANKKTAFIVEHDFIMATYLADRVVLFTGTPGVEATAHTPQSLLSGMNSFLERIQVTFRRDPSNHRARINKKNSSKDKEQKKAGAYFHLVD